MKPPVAPKKNHVHLQHGVSRSDFYYWMHERDSPEVLAYLHAENEYAHAKMAPFQTLEQDIFNEIKSRVPEADTSVPVPLRGYEYYTRFEEGKEYPIYCRKKIGTEEETILLNVNERAEGLTYLDITGLAVSPNNRYLAFGADTTGRRKYTLHIRDVELATDLADSVENTDGSYVWAADNQTLFFDLKDEQTLRSFQIWSYHQPTGKTELTFEEKDETFSCEVSASKDGAYILIHSEATLTSEAYVIPADQPHLAPVSVAPRQRGVRYRTEHYNGLWLIKTNLNAQNFCTMQAPVGSKSMEEWQTLIAHDPETLVEEQEVFESGLLRLERRAAQTYVVFRPWTDFQKPVTIRFPDEVYTVYGLDNPDYTASHYLFQYTSMVTPTTVYGFSFADHSLLVKKQQEIPGGYDANLYGTSRLWATSADGTKVPMSLVYRKDRSPGGPGLLYGYGSYGISVDPQFSVARLSLLDRGWIFAIAHIRGGEEMGRAWYEAGKMAHKMNTFTDFIACGETLIQEGWVGANQLSAMGGSAGGLLMGAVMNLRPELWHSVVSQVPFVDVVTTMLDTSIPLTTGEFDEWGNPAEQEAFHRMLAYSPYDQIQKTAYPHLLVTTGYHDSQVQYWEPAKWVAKLRTHHTGTQNILFITDMEAGHGGKTGRYQRFKEIAQIYTFLLSF